VIPTIPVAVYSKDADKAPLGLTGSPVTFASQLATKISDGLFVLRPVSGLKRMIYEFVSRAGQRELKYGASRFIRIRPQPPPMGIDDGPADRQPHPHAAGFRGVERFENAIDMLRIDARTGIANRDENAISLGFLGTDQQLSRPRLDRTHCFDCVEHQVQDDLLQLNTVSLDGSPPFGKAGLDRDPILGDCASPQYNHLIDRVIEIKTGFSRRRFPDVITYPVDDFSGSIRIAYDTGKRLPDLTQHRRR
jgi:hypothetical protein